MNNEQIQREIKALEAAHKKLLQDRSPKPYSLGRGVYFTNKEYSNQKGTIITQYLEDALYPAYDVKIEEDEVVRVEHSEIYALERGTCR